MYFSLSPNASKAYLQWFPFTKLSSNEKEYISSREFYDKYIKTSAFMFYSQSMHQSENFLQKGDGSFRDSSLVSPILYLILQSVGKIVSEMYTSTRPDNISVYYAGNYEKSCPKYKQSYDNFFKELNSSIEEYQYFIKTDITSFFANINVDKLVTQIDKICNRDNIIFSQMQLHLFRELLLYCGNGRFPLIENSIASSYLSTVVYLDEIDNKLNSYIVDNMSTFSSFRMVRYVDDMYILISCDKPIGSLKDAYNEIRNEYSSILKEFGLSLNTKKCCLKESKEINFELKKSLYDEYYNGQKHNIEDLFSGSLISFLKDISFELLFDSIDVETYNSLIEKHFSSEDIEFTSSEVFNYYIYENEEELRSADVIKEITKIVNDSVSFISLDPKRLTVMLMKTQNDAIIKSFLNQLFKRNRANKWNSYDTTIAISYLIQSKFRHVDLLSILCTRHPRLYNYYFYNCKDSFISCFDKWQTKEFGAIISKDIKAHYLYFMYLCENKRENHMAAFAYFKNFFDRVTADLDFHYGNNPRLRKPNYKEFYKEGRFVAFYKKISGSEDIIKRAHKLRNANPLSHSSSELLDKDNTSMELKKNIEELHKLIYSYIEEQEI